MEEEKVNEIKKPEWLSDSEKIDFIYKTLKRQVFLWKIKVITRIFIILFVIFFYVYIVPKIDYKWLFNEYIMPRIQESISSQINQEQPIQSDTQQIEKELNNRIKNISKKLNISN